MKKRTLLAALLVAPVGVALAQNGYNPASAIKKNESQLSPQEKVTEESKLAIQPGTVTTGGAEVKATQGQATVAGAAAGTSTSQVSDDSIWAQIIKWLQQFMATQSQTGTYQGQAALTGNKPTSVGASTDDMLGQSVNWLQQYFGSQNQPTTYQGQAALTGNRPSNYNQPVSGVSNDSIVMQIIRWLQQQFLATQTEPSQPQINKDYSQQKMLNKAQ